MSAVVPEGRRWNHNIHYHPTVLAAIPAGCARALDVGCGDGILARRLRAVVPHVVALDVDEPTLRDAAVNDGGAGVDYVLGDLLTFPFEPASFDFIASVAVLHHIDAAKGLGRMAELLRPGGRLAIIGLARSTGRADLPYEIAGLVAHRLHLLVKTRWQHKSHWEHSSPTVWPPPDSYAEIRRIVRETLPGARFRRLSLWRYSVVWTKPPAADV